MQRRQDAMLQLVEKIRRVHQRQRHPRDRVFFQQRVDVFRHQKRPPQPHRLHREAFRFQPLRQQRNLRRAPRTVCSFHHDQRSAQLFRLHARQRYAVKMSRQRRRAVRRGWRRRFARALRAAASRVMRRGFHTGPSPCRLGAKRPRSTRCCTNSRICFCRRFTVIVPSITTNLSESTIESYCS